MKKEILENLDDPHALEKLYRENKASFKEHFNENYTEMQSSIIANVWNERLNFRVSEIKESVSKIDWIFVIIGAFVAAFITKMPAMFPAINEEFFFSRNVAFIIFPTLITYFLIKNSVQTKHAVLVAVLVFGALVFINLLPNNTKSDTLRLSCIHLPLFLWSILGFSFVGGKSDNLDQRIMFLRYNGELVVMNALIAIAGLLFTGITIGLFSLINLNIEKIWGEWVIMSGVAASPIVATYLVRTNPELVNRVSPVIARIFSPIVLITLIIYLGAVIVSKQSLYSDREFLLMFNGLLIGVMAIILFSVVEQSRSQNNRFSLIILFLLSVITIVVNGFALSAILFRISEWGITPNRLAVLGGNILILSNLLIVAYNIFGVLFKHKNITSIGNSIASFLPVYSIWTIIVTFLFPFIFGFK